MAVVLRAEETAGVFSLLNARIEAGGQPTPRHSHPAAETFYVLEGTCTLQLEARTVEASSGALVHVPGGVIHAIWNAGTGPARVLTILSPGGMEQYFEEAAAILQSEPPRPDAMELIRVLRQRYGVRDF